MTDKTLSLADLKFDLKSYVEELATFPPPTAAYTKSLLTSFDKTRPGADTTTVTTNAVSSNTADALGHSLTSSQMTATLSAMLAEKRRLIEESFLLDPTYVIVPRLAPPKMVDYANIPPINPASFRQQYLADPFSFPKDHGVQAGKNVIYLMYNPVTHARETVRGLNKYDYERSGWIVENAIDASKVCDVCFGVGMSVVITASKLFDPVSKKAPREPCWHCDGTGLDPTKDVNNV